MADEQRSLRARCARPGLCPAGSRTAASAAVALLAAIVACGSDVLDPGGGGQGAAATSTATTTTSGTGAGGWNPEPDAGTAGSGGVLDDWCKPTVDGYLNGMMVSTCCADQPCWGSCVQGPSGLACDCFGIEGGCPLDAGLVCCQGPGECVDEWDCPPSL